jgi:hypothetical protein
MSDTPETDNVARGNHVVSTGFAQDLERQLSSARAIVHKLRRQRAVARQFGEQMERERDQWRECAVALIYAIDSGDLNDRITARQDFDRLKGQTK